MSSQMKDARWEIACQAVESIGLEFEHITYTGRDTLLSRAQAFLDDHPEAVAYWAEQWGNRE